MTTALANGGKKERRRELDYYPTPPDVTVALMHRLGHRRNSVVWEPACGDGAMARVINRFCDTVISTDLRHTGFGEGGIDFLTTPLRECNAIITNPPFSTSEQFIRRAVASGVPCVAMLLKSQYWHAAKRAALFRQHPPAAVLALTWRPDFMGGERGGAPTMEVLWTVWLRGKTETRYELLERPDLGLI